MPLSGGCDVQGHRFTALTIAALAFTATVAVTISASRAQHQHHEDGRKSETRASERHGNPEGWTFTVPKGNATSGRAVFAKLECYTCHDVAGENFPKPGGGAIGPELSMMGGHHTAEFIAESIMNPSAVVDKGEGYEAPDGSSKMPSFNDVMTVQELADLVAFIQTLKPPARHH